MLGRKTESKITGVIVTDLKIFRDERGAVLHMLRCDSPLFKNFGEIYFSKVFCGVVKAWKQHQQMTLNIAVPVGRIKIVLYDDRPASETRGVVEEFILSEKAYKLVTIPPLLWFGFKGMGRGMSTLANLASLPYSPDEVKTLKISDGKIPYNWSPDTGIKQRRAND